jgi:hypothetical protein
VSSIASLYIVKNSDLPAIVNAAGSARAWKAIHQFGEELDEQYGWPGYVMLNVGLQTWGRPGPAGTKRSRPTHTPHTNTLLVPVNTEARPGR